MALVIIALAIGLAIGLKTITTIDGEKAASKIDDIEYIEYDMTPMGDIVFSELECEACTSILNLRSAGMSKDFIVTDIGENKLVILDANLLITDVVVKSLNRPFMFYGNAKDTRLATKRTTTFFDYFRYDRPFFLNFTDLGKGFWKLQCDFISTYIDVNSTDMLIQLCIVGDKNLVSVTASTSEVSPLIKASLLKYHIFAKNAENVIVIEKEQSIKNQWVAIVCPTAEICRTSCTICKTTAPDYRNRKSVTGSLLEENLEGISFSHEQPYGPTSDSTIKTIPGTAFLIVGDMILTRVVIQSTIMPTMVEIIKDIVTGYESLVPIPIYFVQNTEGMWEWDVDIVYNHLRRRIYIQASYPNSKDLVAATMTMYYISDPSDLPFETADFIRKGFIAQRGNTFLKNAAFTDCACT